MKFLQSRLKNGTDATTGAWPVIGNLNIPRGTKVAVVAAVRFTALPQRRTAVTWFMSESASGAGTGVSQTMNYVAGENQFTLKRVGSVKMNGAGAVADITKFDLNKWYVARIVDTVNDDTAKLNLGAPIGGNGMPSMDWGEGFELFIGDVSEETLQAKERELMQKYGISA